MIHLAPLLGILVAGGASRSGRRRLRLLVRPVPLSIVLHDIGSISRRWLPFNVGGSGVRALGLYLGSGRIAIPGTLQLQRRLQMNESRGAMSVKA
jgi:hypothetical protein